jgi:hypothetical protein
MIFSSACEGTFSSCPSTVRSRHDPRSLREASATQLLQSSWADWKFESHTWQGWKIPVVCMPLCQVRTTTISLWILYDMPVEVHLSLSTPWRHMRQREVEVLNPSFLTSVRDGGERSPPHPTLFYCQTLKNLGGCKSLVHAGNWTLGHLICRLVTGYPYVTMTVPWVLCQLFWWVYRRYTCMHMQHHSCWNILLNWVIWMERLASVLFNEAVSCWE